MNKIEDLKSQPVQPVKRVSEVRVTSKVGSSMQASDLPQVRSSMQASDLPQVNVQVVPFNPMPPTQPTQPMQSVASVPPLQPKTSQQYSSIDSQLSKSSQSNVQSNVFGTVGAFKNEETPRSNENDPNKHIEEDVVGLSHSYRLSNSNVNRLQHSTSNVVNAFNTSNIQHSQQSVPQVNQAGTSYSRLHSVNQLSSSTSLNKKLYGATNSQVNIGTQNTKGVQGIPAFQPRPTPQDDHRDATRHILRKESNQTVSYSQEAYRKEKQNALRDSSKQLPSASRLSNKALNTSNQFHRSFSRTDLEASRVFPRPSFLYLNKNDFKNDNNNEFSLRFVQLGVGLTVATIGVYIIYKFSDLESLRNGFQAFSESISTIFKKQDIWNLETFISENEYLIKIVLVVLTCLILAYPITRVIYRRAAWEIYYKIYKGEYAWEGNEITMKKIMQKAVEVEHVSEEHFKKSLWPFVKGFLDDNKELKKVERNIIKEEENCEVIEEMEETWVKNTIFI